MLKYFQMAIFKKWKTQHCAQLQIETQLIAKIRLANNFAEDKEKYFPYLEIFCWPWPAPSPLSPSWPWWRCPGRWGGCPGRRTASRSPPHWRRGAASVTSWRLEDRQILEGMRVSLFLVANSHSSNSSSWSVCWLVTSCVTTFSFGTLSKTFTFIWMYDQRVWFGMVDPHGTVI